MIRFGVHCSLRKGLTGALEDGRRLGCESIQIFTRSPRMWRMRIPDQADVEAFKRLRRAAGIFPLVVHTPYLPNLATSSVPLYELSRRALVDDLTVAGMLEADYLVIHPGSYSLDSDPATGIARIAEALREGLRRVKGRTAILLENVAGGGRRIGASFGELRSIMDRCDSDRLAVCLDTAHALGAGYDLSTKAGIDRALEEFDETVGLERLAVIHFNDSRTPLASRRDRHEHLGRGYIGSEGFKYLVGRVKNVAAAGILETPKDTPAADRRNLRLLFSWRDGKRR